MNVKSFEVVESEGSTKAILEIVDKKTGVNYLVAKFGVAGGL